MNVTESTIIATAHIEDMDSAGLRWLSDAGLRPEIYETVEVPFGWVFFYQSAKYVQSLKEGIPDDEFAFIGAHPVIVNRWTGEPGDLETMGSNLEAWVRWHIDTLPEEQRQWSLERLDLMPFSPVRFYPPLIWIDNVTEWDRLDDIRFHVILDTQWFEERDVSIPELKICWDYSKLFRLNLESAEANVSEVKQYYRISIVTESLSPNLFIDNFLIFHIVLDIAEAILSERPDLEESRNEYDLKVAVTVDPKLMRRTFRS